MYSSLIPFTFTDSKVYLYSRILLQEAYLTLAGYHIKVGATWGLLCSFLYADINGSVLWTFPSITWYVDVDLCNKQVV